MIVALQNPNFDEDPEYAKRAINQQDGGFPANDPGRQSDGALEDELMSEDEMLKSAEENDKLRLWLRYSKE